jgi:hypothetical protein
MTEPSQPRERKYPPPPPPQPQTPLPPQQQYAPAQPPQYYGYQQPGYPVAVQKPSAYWPLSIIAVLLSLVFGIIAIVYSAQVNTRWNAGDIAGAKSASKKAMIFGIIGVAVGVIVIIAVAGSSGNTGS